MKYDLEIEKAVEAINQSIPAKVLVQLPDGLKPKADIIKKALEEQTNAEVFIWMGSCFGACDVPYYTENFGIEMIIQWGHSAWKSSENESYPTPETEEKEEYKYTPLFG